MIVHPIIPDESKALAPGLFWLPKFETHRVVHVGLVLAVLAARN